MVYGVCMLYRIWCIEPVEPPWLARGGSIAPVEPPLATGMGTKTEFNWVERRWSGVVGRPLSRLVDNFSASLTQIAA